MCDERLIRRVAGSVVLASLALAVLVSPFWLLLTGFVGANLLQSSFSRWCPLERVLGRLGWGGCRQRSEAAPRQG